MTRARWICIAALGASLQLAPAYTSPAFADDRPTATTSSGPVAGVTANSADEFLGIPYAAPPIGALRWQAPHPPAAWTEVRDGSKHATRCSAPSAGDGPRLVNEDCLYLDVYRPAGAAPDAKLPVTVFIHGGGNYSGSTDIYDGSRMASEGKTVVVALAYRLGAFGYLALPGDAASGDYGLLDQLQALQWVRDNIAGFGGNPADVTLAGESSGGTAVCSLLATPSSKGLYAHAVIQSGVCQVDPSLAAAEKNGAAFAAKVGCSDASDIAACLRAKPAGDLIDKWGSDITGPAYGTKLLPENPMQAFATGAFNAVPTLIGFARNEMYGFMHGMYPLSEAAYQAIVKQKFGDKAPELLSRYPTAKFPHNEYAFGALQGDSFLVCHAFKLADMISQHAPVSMYEFADMTVPNWKSLGNAQPAPAGYHVGAGHTSELPYLLDYKAIESPLNADQLGLARAMIGRWVDFGRKSDAAEWPAYSPTDRKVVEIQLPAAGGIKTIADSYQAHNCDFWNKP